MYLHCEKNLFNVMIFILCNLLSSKKFRRYSLTALISKYNTSSIYWGREVKELCNPHAYAVSATIHAQIGLHVIMCRHGIELIDICKQIIQKVDAIYALYLSHEN